MNSVYKCTNAKTIEKPEYKSHSCGASAKPVESKKSFTSPFLPKRGIHEIILITFDVQNGIVQSKNNAICQVTEFM